MERTQLSLFDVPPTQPPREGDRIVALGRELKITRLGIKWIIGEDDQGQCWAWCESAQLLKKFTPWATPEDAGDG